MAVTEPLLPGPNGAACEQSVYNRWFRVKDVVGFAIFVAWYLFQAWLLSPQVGFPAIFESPRWSIKVLQACLTVIGLVAVVEQLSLPPPEKGEDFYDLMRYCGRWIFLTRHCIALQGLHMVFSLAAIELKSAFLDHLAYAAAFWIGSLGCFVTIQFFALVLPDPVFQARCAELAARNPPVNLRQKGILMHTPGLLLAVGDVLIVKSHVRLRVECSLLASLAMCLCYVVVYLLVIVPNYRATGHWPYGFLRNLNTVGSWAMFVIGQTAFLCSLCTAMWLLSMAPSIL